MAAAPDLAPIGALIGEPSRAAILSELMDGRALTATELATRAGVSPATASVHLAKLVSGGLLAVEPSGRHRYFRLARPRVARALETLAGLTPRVPAASSGGPPTDDIRFARTCYDHLAGWLGVGIRNALVEKGFLLPAGSEFRLTRKGDAWMAAFGVDVAAVRSGRRSFARGASTGVNAGTTSPERSAGPFWGGFSGADGSSGGPGSGRLS